MIDSGLGKRRDRRKKAAAAFYGALLFCGIGSTSLLAANLNITKGTGLFTNQINEIAEQSLENLSEGEKELYVFPEWGLMCGFNYLTMNQVDYLTSLEEARIKDYSIRGYQIRVFYFQEENEEQYREALERTGITEPGDRSYSDGRGEPVLYELSSQDGS